MSIANKNLETYIELATEAQEDERKRLSRKLHDDTMQAPILTLAQIEIATIQDVPDAARVQVHPRACSSIGRVTDCSSAGCGFESHWAH